MTSFVKYAHVDVDEPLKKYLVYVGAIYYPTFGADGDLVGSADSLEDAKAGLEEALQKEHGYYQWEIVEHATFKLVESGGSDD